MAKFIKIINGAGETVCYRSDAIVAIGLGDDGKTTLGISVGGDVLPLSLGDIPIDEAIELLGTALEEVGESLWIGTVALA